MLRSLSVGYVGPVFMIYFVIYFMKASTCTAFLVIRELLVICLIRQCFPWYIEWDDFYTADTLCYKLRK